MRIVNIHYNTRNNINKYYLAQHVEWHCEENDLVLYNTLFDSVVIAKPQSIGPIAESCLFIVGK